MTRFADMPSGSLNGWLLWCERHDWGQGPDFPAWFDEMTGDLVTYCWVSEGHGMGYVEEGRHQTPRDLKAWAGY